MSARSTPSAKDLPAVAYAHYVLARAKAGDAGACAISPTRSSRTCRRQLAKAQLAAALGAIRRHDAGRARPMHAALAPPPQRPAGLRYVDYGSDLRDSAAVLAFAAGNPAMQPRLTAVMDRGRRTVRRAPAAPARRSRPGC